MLARETDLKLKTNMRDEIMCCLKENNPSFWLPPPASYSQRLLCCRLFVIETQIGSGRRRSSDICKPTENSAAVSVRIISSVNLSLCAREIAKGNVLHDDDFRFEAKLGPGRLLEC